MELSTERPAGMGIGSIPVSKIWDYLDRFGLPDWWEAVLLQADASLVASMNKEHERGNVSKSATAKPAHDKGGGQGGGAIRSG